MIRFVLFILLSASVAFGAIDEVIRRPEQLGLSRREVTMSRVKSVQVVMADYDLIARDFPAQAKLPGESKAAWQSRVDAWLVSETGFILKPQASQETVNTQIPVTDETKSSWRPRGYNRADVIPVAGGLMDSKGTGTENPRQRHHGNGLATLGEMIREYIFEKSVQMIFDDARVSAKTVGSYAVLDYGFDVIHADGSKDRAGLILRQAHQRIPEPGSALPKQASLGVEMLLRRYGLTSSGETYAYRSQPSTAPEVQFDYTNIQGTNHPRVIEVIDFGAYLAVERFQHHIVSHENMDLPVIRPGDQAFRQPDPALRFPLEQWGASGDKQDPKADKPWVWSHDLARAWAEGRADRSAFDRHLENMLGPLRQRLSPIPRCQAVF